MKLKSITNGLSKATGKTGLMLKKHSPEILLVVGVTGTVASAVLACRATLKVDAVMDEHREKVEKVNEALIMAENGDIDSAEYTQQDHKKDLTVVYTQTAVNFIKVYGPAITLGVMSLSCIIASHGIMKKRNAALTAACTSAIEAFNLYRKRVVEEYGEEKDYMLKHGLRSEVVTETEAGEDGKPIKVKKTKLVEDPNGLSMYARFFDEASPEWSETAEYNFMFLKAQQNYFNDILKVRGHVFLNEVYDTLGFERSQAGSVVGWVIGDGDNYIDFGIFDGDRPKAREFVNGFEKSILLDFNVDGVIYDKFQRDTRV